MIYLDNAATTRIHPDVLDAMMPYLEYEYGNPGSLYALGRRANAAVGKAREQVAKFINAAPEQVIFTSGGSEANNLVFHGLKETLKIVGKTHVLVSAIEHDSALKAANSLIKDGFDVELIPPRQGAASIDPETVRHMLRPETGLVSVMYVNNETGDVSDIPAIAALCHEHAAFFHTDCVQAAGYLTLDTQGFGCDFLSISSHKIHGPKGMGALYARDPSLLTPLIFGGSSQEFGLRGGTENVANIVGFGAACEFIHKVLSSSYTLRCCPGDYLAEELMQKLRGCHINGSQDTHKQKILNMRFDGVDAQTLLLMLDSYEVCASAGSACCSMENTPSHVLKAIGLSDEEARASVRFSFSRLNFIKELDDAAEIIADCVTQLRGDYYG